MAKFKDSALMYLTPMPYKTICIEVDAVEGAEPKDKAVDALAEFLRKYCGKPVTVVRKKTIPRSSAEGLPPQLIAFQNIQGPAKGSDKEPSAYIYVLFYRGAGDWKQAGHARLDYPCSIFIDMACVGLSGQRQVLFGLKHEAGHLLGLCSNLKHGDGAHCNNRRCIMYHAFSSTRSLLRLGATDLCDECKRDLLEVKNSGAVSKLKFKGPFLIRQEKGYFVGNLPGAFHLGIGSVETFDWEKTLNVMRKSIVESKKTQPRVYATLVSQANAFLCFISKNINTRADFVKQQSAIEAATKDPDARVRKVAKELKKRLETKFGPQPNSCNNLP